MEIDKWLITSGLVTVGLCAVAMTVMHRDIPGFVLKWLVLVSAAAHIALYLSWIMTKP